MKKFLIIAVVVLAIAVIAYMAYKKFGKPVEETVVPNATTLSQTPVTPSTTISDVTSGEVAQITLDAQKAAVRGGSDETILREGRKINQV